MMHSSSICIILSVCSQLPTGSSSPLRDPDLFLFIHKNPHFSFHSLSIPSPPTPSFLYPFFALTFPTSLGSLHAELS